MTTINITEYTLSTYSTLDIYDDEENPFGPEICTDDHYAYVLKTKTVDCPYTPNPRPNDFWEGKVVSAVAWWTSGLHLLTIEEYFKGDSDLYLFCHPICTHRIGVIRSGQTALVPDHKSFDKLKMN
ncbi:hypothetical protein QUF58_07240 [Anaerolineales bacterium HSG24]|nr:hypothetical protein [Anaerolineales bacterium HSG24]